MTNDMRERIARAIVKDDWPDCEWDEVTETIREEALCNADAIIAALPEMVKPLEWIACSDGTLHDLHCLYEMETDGGFWRVTKAVTGGGSYVCDAPTIEAAKAAANAHHVAHIMAALGIGDKA